MQENIYGYFSFKDILDDGQKALDAGLYRISLMLALIIPSICSRIEFEDNSKYQDENNRWKDRDCYVDWCLMHNIKFFDAENKYGEVDKNRLDEEYCQHIYDVRCSIVHESVIKCDDMVCNLCANTSQRICKKVYCDNANQRDICVVPFCRQMFKIGRAYYEGHREKFDITKIPMKMYQLNMD